MRLLTSDEIDSALADLPDWTLIEAEDSIGQANRLVRSFVCADYPAAVEFLRLSVEPCETMNHHPDVHVVWRTVDIALTTHDAGGVTQADVELAHQLNGAFQMVRKPA